jgi:antitoxin MazE
MATFILGGVKMSHTKCRAIGTSQGVIIPHHILAHAHINISDVLDVKYSIKNDSIIIKKMEPTQIRKGWDLAFKTMHKNNDDKLIIDDIFEDENLDVTI